MSIADDPTPSPETSDLANAVAAHDAANPEPTPESAPEPTPEPTPESAPEPTPEPAPTAEPTAGPTPEPEPEPESETKFMDFVHDTYPDVDLSKKYANDAAALDGLVNASRLVGQRDDDAELGKAIRASGREGDIRTLLSGQPPAPQQPQPQPAPQQQQPPSVPTYEGLQYLQSQVQQREDGTVGPAPGAPADAVQRLQVATEQAHRAMIEMAREPEKVLQPMFEQQQQAVRQQVQEQLAQQSHQQAAAQQFRAEVAAFEERNESWLFVNGKRGNEMTSYAKQFAEEVKNSSANRFEERANNAMWKIQQSMPQNTRPPLPPKPQAVHQPAVATPPAADPKEEYSNRLKSMTMVEHMMAQAADEAAASGVAG